MIVTQLRTYYADQTVSRLLIDGIDQPELCIEDVGRPSGIKIQDQTCIPEGVYGVDVTHSARFKKPMILLYNHPTDRSVRDGSAIWTGIRVHAGSSTLHTAGCVLYSLYTHVQSRVESELAAGRPVYWIIGRDI
jgi:hypothetical protein